MVPANGKIMTQAAKLCVFSMCTLVILYIYFETTKESSWQVEVLYIKLDLKTFLQRVFVATVSKREQVYQEFHAAK